MYNSIRKWMTLPAQVIPFIRRDGTGTKLFKDPVDHLCYAEGTIQVVTDSKGVEVVSNLSIYFEGSTDISELDAVVFENKKRDIRAISTFYDKGVPDLKVVYL